MALLMPLAGCLGGTGNGSDERDVEPPESPTFHYKYYSYFDSLCPENMTGAFSFEERPVEQRNCERPVTDWTDDDLPCATFVGSVNLPTIANEWEVYARYTMRTGPGIMGQLRIVWEDDLGLWAEATDRYDSIGGGISASFDASIMRSPVGLVRMELHADGMACTGITMTHDSNYFEIRPIDQVEAGSPGRVA